jgi:hypothetical protein
LTGRAVADKNKRNWNLLLSGTKVFFSEKRDILTGFALFEDISPGRLVAERKRRCTRNALRRERGFKGDERLVRQDFED